MTNNQNQKSMNGFYPSQQNYNKNSNLKNKQTNKSPYSTLPKLPQQSGMYNPQIHNQNMNYQQMRSRYNQNMNQNINTNMNNNKNMNTNMNMNQNMNRMYMNQNIGQTNQMNKKQSNTQKQNMTRMNMNTKTNRAMNNNQNMNTNMNMNQNMNRMYMNQNMNQTNQMKINNQITHTIYNRLKKGSQQPLINQTPNVIQTKKINQRKFGMGLNNNTNFGLLNQNSMNFRPNTYFNQQQRQPQKIQNKQQKQLQLQQIKVEKPKFMPRNINMLSLSNNKKIKSYNNSKERELLENESNLFSIMQTLENLEKAYVRDSITSKEYTNECWKMISQFKTALSAVGIGIKEVPKWLKEKDIDLPAASKVLIVTGVPSTVTHGLGITDSNQNSSVFIFETASYFITAMDSVKLNMIAVDQIQPILTDLMNSINKIENLPQNYQGSKRLMKWLSTLNLMKASDELTEEQSRQLLFELETAYNELMSTLQQKK
ncbi:vacuolar protein sorting-associated protein [Anaeramoeba flamelloides]|uniref:Vacuolar protein sorting-associated protein n=1 Tax=Anaeramoeba flamelloides TaxID=1746091 RepID=A0ABQ8XEJ2_9EUKA|nr:vacuolar protein sorting-associated protein [Anaeramoeba flamelloides]